MPPLAFTLTPDPIVADEPRWDPGFGADVSFFGVVRSLEGTETIAGIEYSAYPEMVTRSAKTIGAAAEAEFPPHRATIVHRTGFVAAAEPSVLLRVGSAHSAEALAICEFYLGELKRSIPIWKRFVPAG